MAANAQHHESESTPPENGRLQRLPDEQLLACGDLACHEYKTPATSDPDVVTAELPAAPESEPTLADRLAAREMSRRGFTGAAIKAILTAEAVSLFGGITWIIKGSSTPAGRIITARDRFVAMLNAQPTAEEVVQQISAIPGVLPYIDLAHERDLLGLTANEPLPMGQLDYGNSYTYMLGVMNDGGGIHNQPNAISSVTMNSLGPDACAALGLGTTSAASCAQIGGYSGDEYPGDPGQPYGNLSVKQWGSPEVQAYLRDWPGLMIARGDLPLDDMRLLIATSAQLAASMDDLTALFTNDKSEKRAEANLDMFEALVPAIAEQAGQHDVEVAAIAAGISDTRIANGGSRVVQKLVICWDIGDKNQVLIPANTITKPDALALKYLKPDPTGPNRYFIDADSIPYGHEIAHWIWVEMVQARADAIRRIRTLFGDKLAIVPVNLSRVNRDPNFYRSALGVAGNGHEGPEGIVDMAGVELGLLHNPTASGVVIASSLAHIEPPKVA